MLDLDVFTAHLPAARAGKWATPNINSTVSNSHGLDCRRDPSPRGRNRRYGTVQAPLDDGGRRPCDGVRHNFPQRQSSGTCPVPGVWVGASIARRTALILGCWSRGIGRFSSGDDPGPTDRQPVTQFCGGLSATGCAVERPLLERRLVRAAGALEERCRYAIREPGRWLIGYGVGNYVEYRNAAHNMVLGLMQDGGFVALFFVGALWIRLLKRIWRMRGRSWPLVAVTAGLLSSSMTSAILMPNLATGWYLGFFFVCFYIMPARPTPSGHLVQTATEVSFDWQAGSRRLVAAGASAE